MIRQTMNPAFLNEVANHPSVRPFVAAGDTPLDLTPLVTNPNNICLVMEHGGWVIQRLDAGLYEVHSLFLPEGRGRDFQHGAKEGVRWMFTRTECVDLVTRCPDDNGAARIAAALVGFKERYRREKAWHTGAGISYQGMTLEQWALRDKACLTAGIALHEAFEEAKVAFGSALPEHPEDVVHDHIAGAAVLIAEAGNIPKAVAFYNRWAIFPGYGRIAQVGPGCFEVDGAILAVNGAKVEVLFCR